MGLLNFLEFDGENSFEYGVYISGEGTFDAPRRRARKISIPGRDGDLVLDEGSFENIQVSYPAFIVARNQAEFKEKLEAFRSALLSKTGYVRLSDTYHKDEYRMAAYLEGLEVSPKLHNKAGNFTLVFDCKPQRFLKIGDLPVSVASGDTITNPTLFDAHPLVKFNSNGTDGSIVINGQTITMFSSYVGIIGLDLSASYVSQGSYDDITIQNVSSYNAGDTITFGGGAVSVEFPTFPITDVPTVNANGIKATPYIVPSGGFGVSLKVEDCTFTAGTSQRYVKTVTIEAEGVSRQFDCDIYYNGNNKITVAYTIRPFGSTYITKRRDSYKGTVNSTKNALEDVDIYIDLDIGEAYSIGSNDNVISLNNFINLGSDLPTLPAGDTTISYSANISNVEITPRWWRV